MPFAFEKLVVYQKAVTFANAACVLTKGVARGYFFLADQPNTAAVSIPANIAEGNGRFTKPDRKNFFGIARGSVQTTCSTSRTPRSSRRRRRRDGRHYRLRPQPGGQRFGYVQGARRHFWHRLRPGLLPGTAPPDPPRFIADRGDVAMIALRLSRARVGSCSGYDVDAHH